MVEPGKAHLPTPRPSGPMWMTMALGAVILLSGIAIGVGASMIFMEPGETVVSTGTQSETPPKFDPRPIVDSISRHVGGLDSDTQQKVEAILKDTHEKISKIRRSAGEEMHEVIQAMDTSMKEVLTEEQYSSWKERIEKVQHHRRPPYHSGRGGYGGRKPGFGGHRGGEKGPMSGSPSRFMLERFDRNKDGIIEQPEVPGDLWKRIRGMDKNGDSKIDKAELEEFRNKMRDRRPFGDGRGPGRGGMPSTPSEGGRL